MRGQLPAEIVEEGLEREGIGRSVVFSADCFCRKLAEAIESFIGQSRATHHSHRRPAMLFLNHLKFGRGYADGLVPRCRDQPAALFVSDHRRANACLVIYERVSEPSLDAKKLAIQ